MRNDNTVDDEQDHSNTDYYPPGDTPAVISNNSDDKTQISDHSIGSSDEVC